MFRIVSLKIPPLSIAVPLYWPTFMSSTKISSGGMGSAHTLKAIHTGRNPVFAFNLSYFGELSV